MLKWRRCAFAGLLFSALLIFPLASQAQSQPAGNPAQQSAAPAYDGDWWLSLGGWEQYGFLSGYVDCYAFEYRGSAPFTKEIQTYIDSLNRYYLGDSTRRKQTVSEALDTMRNAAGDTGAPAAGEPQSGAHGEFDGKFWFEADTAAELGFVEGYLACHSVKLKDADAKFSRPPSEYVDLINKAYNITDDTDDVDADKAPIKIADVLHRLKDEASPQAKPAN